MTAHNENDGYRRELRATGWLAIGTLAWLATLALAQFGPGLLWGSEQTVLSWVAVALNLAVGVGWIVVFIRYLRSVDELNRKIMLDALAATLGVGWVGGFAYIVAESAGLVAYDQSTLGIFSALLGVVFIVGVVIGRIRYR